VEEALAPVHIDCVPDVTRGQLLSEDAQFFFLVTVVHIVKSLVIKRNHHGATRFMAVNHWIVSRIPLR